MCSFRLDAVCFVLVTALVASSFAAQNGQAPPDVAAEVQAVFAAKCSQCHAASLARPKGRFGYVTDLRRVAANPKIVVPFHADQSKLWTQVEKGDMPPEDARAGVLSNRDKALIRWWIEGGAPAPGGTSQPAVVDASTPSPAPVSFFGRFVRWIGRFHVLVIHFPIALLVSAAVAEAWWLWGRRFGMNPAVRYCVLLGAAGAVAAAALGWVRAPFSGYADAATTLLLHRWIGTAAGLCAVTAAVASELDVQRRQRSRLFRAALFTAALLVGAAGHLGGTLVYGDGYFNW